MPRTAIRTQRFAMRLTDDEREILKRVSEALGDIDMAEFVRDVSMTMARTVLQLQRGEIPLPAAMGIVSSLFYRFIGWQRLSDLHNNGNLPAGPYTFTFTITDQAGNVIHLDEETREVAP